MDNPSGEPEQPQDYAVLAEFLCEVFGEPLVSWDSEPENGKAEGYVVRTWYAPAKGTHD